MGSSHCQFFCKIINTETVFCRCSTRENSSAALYQNTTLLKRDSRTSAFVQFFEFFKNTVFTKLIRMSASVNLKLEFKILQKYSQDGSLLVKVIFIFLQGIIKQFTSSKSSSYLYTMNYRRMEGVQKLQISVEYRIQRLFNCLQNTFIHLQFKFLRKIDIKNPPSVSKVSLSIYTALSK